MWQNGVNINEVQTLRLRNTVYFGVGALDKIFEVITYFKEHGICRVLAVAGKSAYLKCGAWEKLSSACCHSGVELFLYNKVTPNPTTDQVDEAVALGKTKNVQAVIGIGGGSPIDAAKCIAVLLKYPGKLCTDLTNFKLIPAMSLPLAVINLTHGTGTEVDRFAVVTDLKNEFKPALAYDCMYPMFAIEDPELMTSLSPRQTLYVSIDAINHVVEAATSKMASAYSIMLAEQTVKLVVQYLPQAKENPEDLKSRYWLLFASMLAGVSFDNGILHFTHALEHPLSAVKPDLTHGLGLAILLPAVIEKIYPARAAILSGILRPIAPHLSDEGTPENGLNAALAVEKWLFELGVTEKLEDFGFTEADIPKLTALTFSTPSLQTLLDLAPVCASKECVKDIYLKSLKPMRQ